MVAPVVGGNYKPSLSQRCNADYLQFYILQLIKDLHKEIQKNSLRNPKHFTNNPNKKPRQLQNQPFSTLSLNADYLQLQLLQLIKDLEKEILKKSSRNPKI